jgi:hypothetical protein
VLRGNYLRKIDGNACPGSIAGAGFVILRKEKLMTEIERELTFLIERLPADLAKFPSKIIDDNYIPAT